MSEKCPQATYHDASVFKELFGREASETIQDMDNAGDDIANQAPSVGIDINLVGIDDKRTYFNVEDPLASGSPITLYSKVRVGIEVPKTLRGIHVSRLNDSIARISQARTYKNVHDFAHALASDIKQTQQASLVSVKVEADYITFADVQTINQAPPKKTQDRFLLLAEASIDNDNELAAAGIEVNHITSCPCVQQTIRHAVGKESDLPLLTHSQRSITRILLTGLSRDVNLAEFLKSVDAAVFLARDTLPRPGEASLVFRSHEQPQFIEDVVRQVAHQLYRQFGESHPEAGIHIESRSLESIHTFDIVAVLDTSMRELKAHGLSAAPQAHKKIETRWNPLSA